MATSVKEQRPPEQKVLTCGFCPNPLPEKGGEDLKIGLLEGKGCTDCAERARSGKLVPLPVG